MHSRENEENSKVKKKTKGERTFIHSFIYDSLWRRKRSEQVLGHKEDTSKHERKEEEREHKMKFGQQQGKKIVVDLQVTVCMCDLPKWNLMNGLCINLLVML